MSIKQALLSTLIVLPALLIAVAQADTVVIVHPSNASTITPKDIKRLYLAKTKSFSNGVLALPLNQVDTNKTRILFDKTVIKKNENQMKSYWARLVFTGKATPIKQVMNEDDIVTLVSKNPSTIGYIDSAKVDDSVKAVYTF